MLEVVCKYCGEKKRVKPADVKDPEKYHCRKCHPLYLKEKRENGLMKWDRKALNKLNTIAMKNGHKSIFSNGKSGENNGYGELGNIL